MYLVRCDGGWLLVDCGFGNDDTFHALEASLAQAGVEWPHIRQIVVTHGHPDHWGLAPRILALSGAGLAMHAVEAEHLKQIAEAVHRPSMLDKRLRSWGTPEELITRITGAFLSFRQEFRPLTPTRVLNDGDAVETGALGPLRVVFTPGHAPGHICLYSPRDRVLLSGDHVLPKITPHVSWMEETDALADFNTSLDRVAALDVTLVAPSHGDPFPNLAARAAEIRRHHDIRCDAIRKALDSGACTPHEVVGVLWPRVLSPFNYRFAIYEVMAHMKFMGLT